jgi:hypothetical protein
MNLKKAALLLLLTILIVPGIASAGKRHRRRAAKAPEMPLAGQAIAGLVGVAGFLALRHLYKA